MLPLFCFTLRVCMRFSDSPLRYLYVYDLISLSSFFSLFVYSLSLVWHIKQSKNISCMYNVHKKNAQTEENFHFSPFRRIHLFIGLLDCWWLHKKNCSCWLKIYFCCLLRCAGVGPALSDSQKVKNKAMENRDFRKMSGDWSMHNTRWKPNRSLEDSIKFIHNHSAIYAFRKSIWLS